MEILGYSLRDEGRKEVEFVPASPEDKRKRYDFEGVMGDPKRIDNAELKAEMKRS